MGIRKIKSFKHHDIVEKSIFTILDQLKAESRIRIPSRAKVMIKPNICSVAGYETGATVDPFIVKCLVKWLLENNDIDKINIGEADATTLNASIAFKALGWERTFADFENVNLVNLSKEKKTCVKLSGLLFENLNMPNSYIKSDFLISVGKMKTHTLCGVSCILKNQFGSNPFRLKFKFHKMLSEAIHDMYKIRPPDLCLLDGLIAMEGDGPIAGTPKPIGTLLVGNDAVTVDLASIEIMGFKLRHVPYLKLLLEQDPGKFDYEIFGEKLNKIKTRFSFRPFWKRTILKIYQRSLQQHQKA